MYTLEIDFSVRIQHFVLWIISQVILLLKSGCLWYQSVFFWIFFEKQRLWSCGDIKKNYLEMFMKKLINVIQKHLWNDFKCVKNLLKWFRNAREKRRRAVSTVVNMHQVTFHHHHNHHDHDHHHRHHYNVDYQQNKSVQSTSDDTSLSSESGDELSKLGRVG